MALVGSPSRQNGSKGVGETAAFFFEADAQRRALEYVGYSLNQGRGVFLLTGESGCGKSTIMTHVADVARARGGTVIAFPAQSIEGRDLFRQLAAEFGLPHYSVPQSELLDELERQLIRCISHNSQPLLIIDNAEKLTEGDLLAVTQLCDLQNAGDYLLQVILIGESFPPREFVSRSGSGDVSHLLAAYQLTPLLADEIETYVTAWLRFHGTSSPPAMPTAVRDRLYLWSAGLMGRLQPLLAAAHEVLTHDPAWQWNDETLAQLITIVDRAGAEPDVETVRNAARDSLRVDKQAGRINTGPLRPGREEPLKVERPEMSPSPPSKGPTFTLIDEPGPTAIPPAEVADVAIQTPIVALCADLEEAYLLTPLLKAVARSMGHCTLLHQGNEPDLDALDWSKGMRRVVELHPYRAPTRTGEDEADRLAGYLAHSVDLLRGQQVRLVIALNDSDETLALCLAAHKFNIPVVRIEAGRRWNEPGRNTNVTQQLIDRLASLYLVSDHLARAHLVMEGLSRTRIHEVGTLRVDALARYLAKQGISLSGAAEEVRHKDQCSYALVVLRDKQLATPEKLEPMLHVLRDMGELVPVRLLVSEPIKEKLEHSTFGAHQRKWNVDHFATLDPVRAIASLEHARLVVTDSEYLQVEAAVLKIPCITLAEHTAWPMTVESGANRLCSLRPLNILEAVSQALAGGQKSTLPSNWDGKAAARSLAAIKLFLPEIG